MNNGLQLMT